MSSTHLPSTHRTARTIAMIAAAAVIALIVGITIGKRLGSTTAPLPPPTSVAAAPPEAPAAATAAPVVAATPLRAPARDDEQTINGEKIDDGPARAQLHAFQSRFAAERVDANWAAAAETTLRRGSADPQILQLEAEPSRLDIDCKTSICRMEVDFPSRRAADDWFTLVSLAVPEMSRTSFEHATNPDGSARLVVYGILRK